MTGVLRIALVSPHAWPPRDDVAHHVAAEAAALAAPRPPRHDPGPRHRAGARRGGPGAPAAAAAGRRPRRAARARRARCSRSPSAAPCPTGPGGAWASPSTWRPRSRRRSRRTPFDVVHLHEPLAPSPALAALRHARGRHGRHLPPRRAARRGRLPAARWWTARWPGPTCASPPPTRAARALAEILPGDYEVIAARAWTLERLADAGPQPDGPPGLVLVARGRDRVGRALRARRAARPLDLDGHRAGHAARAGRRPLAHARRRAEGAARAPSTVVPDAGPASRAAGAPHGGRIAAARRPRRTPPGPVLRGGAWPRAARCWRRAAPRSTRSSRHGVDGARPAALHPRGVGRGRGGAGGRPGAAGGAGGAGGRARAAPAPGTTWPRDLEAAYRAASLAGAPRGAAEAAGCSPTCACARAPSSSPERSWPPAAARGIGRRGAWRRPAGSARPVAAAPRRPRDLDRDRGPGDRDHRRRARRAVPDRGRARRASRPTTRPPPSTPRAALVMVPAPRRPAAPPPDALRAPGRRGGPATRSAAATDGEATRASRAWRGAWACCAARAAAPTRPERGGRRASPSCARFDGPRRTSSTALAGARLRRSRRAPRGPRGTAARPRPPPPKS